MLVSVHPNKHRFCVDAVKLLGFDKFLWCLHINPSPGGLSELLILVGGGETTCSPKVTVMDTFWGVSIYHPFKT